METDYPTRDGSCIRDYIHVADLASAHVKALNYLEKGGESDVFNLGNGAGFTVKEIIEVSEKIAGVKINAAEGPRREGDPSNLIAEYKKASEKLDWKSDYAEIEKIIESTWKWMKLRSTQ